MIESASAGLVYYGSTKNNIVRRFQGHKGCFRKWQAGKGCYTTSYEVLKHNDARVILVETITYENKQELLAREAHYIRNNDCVNRVVPLRTQKQYNADNADVIKHRSSEYHKGYYAKNQVALIEHSKQYYLEHKNQKQAYDKQYRQDNLAKKQATDKQYRQVNKNKLKQHYGEQITCECGSTIRRGEIQRHRRTMKHIKQFILL